MGEGDKQGGETKQGMCTNRGKGLCEQSEQICERSEEAPRRALYIHKLYHLICRQYSYFQAGTAKTTGFDNISDLMHRHPLCRLGTM